MIEVTVYTRIADIPKATAEAFSIRSGVAFFNSIEWFDCLARYGLENASPRIYVASDKDFIRAALFCLKKGRQLHSLTNFYTICFGPTNTAGNTSIDDIAACIAAERPAWTTIDLRNLHQRDLELMQDALRAHGFATHSREQYINWFFPVKDATFEIYYANLSSQLQNTIKRKTRKARQSHNIRLALYPGDDLTLNEVIEHYETVYAASWKEPEPYPDFMPALFRLCDKHHLVRAGLAWVDEEPAAAQIWINESPEQEQKRTYIYKLAYDEKFGRLSIGSMLSKKMFEHAIEVDKVGEIDYGVGDERYKRDWMSKSRSLNGLLAFNKRSLVGRFRNLRESLAARRQKKITP